MGFMIKYLENMVITIHGTILCKFLIWWVLVQLLKD